GAINHALADIGSDRHLRNLLLDQTERRNRNTELMTLFRIFGRYSDQPLCTGNRADPKFEPADVENVEGNLMALAYFAQDVLDRHLRILKIDRAGRRSVEPHLVLLRGNRYAGKRPLHDEPGELVAIHLRKNDEDVGKAGVSDPHLLTVQDVVLAIRAQLCGSLRRERVGA